MGFFKKFWYIVKSDVVNALKEFYVSGTLPKSVHHTFLCLIPKKEAISDIRDLRPISLVSSLYKILSKVLMERLKVFMGGLVAVEQCAFVGGRQILDAILIANELIDSRKRARKPGLVFKLDIEKAYDHVNWECLFIVMKTMGFPPPWIRWIRGCITAASFSVLVNGEASGYFSSKRGLRQGDSLSPCLFILVMEVLSGILRTLQSRGLVEGFFMNEELRMGEVTHILYADDTLLFCDASEDQVRSLLTALPLFETISGLRVNLHKSSMMVVGEVENPSRYADIFGCELSSLPTTYLGLPLGSRAASLTVWEPVIEKVQARLASWKARMLSFGGRLVLLKSVLSNLPIYFLSLFRAPSSVIARLFFLKRIARLEKIYNDFLWSGVFETKRLHWVKWDIVKTPIIRGGLGVLDLRCMNRALLGKWAWRFGVERDAWWRRLIVAKFGQGRSEWRPCWNLGVYGCSVWRAIVNESSYFWKVAYVDPGGGFGVSFWHDFWVPGKLLVSDFPRVGFVAQSLDAFVSDMFSMVDRSWEIPLTISLRGGAEAERVLLMQTLNALPQLWITTGPARLVWPLEASMVFSVHSFATNLIESNFGGDTAFPFKLVWNPCVPSKICCFLWMVSHEKIATVDNLRKRGMILPNWCSLCKQHEESISHLFFSCPFAIAIWDNFKKAFDLHGPYLPFIRQFLIAWRGLWCDPRFRDCIKLLPHAVCWYIWLERNNRIFRDVESSPKEIGHKIVLIVGRWLRAFSRISDRRFHQWMVIGTKHLI
ncbi:unnamed protein product [Linum trigynum]